MKLKLYILTQIIYFASKFYFLFIIIYNYLLSYFDIKNILFIQIYYSSPHSSISGKKLPFSISLNNQQQTKQDIEYYYYENPQIYSIEPNKGPDDGNSKILLHGQNFNPFKELNTLSNKNDTFCRFGEDIKLPGEVISSTEMECYTPPSYEVRSYILEITLNNRDYTDDDVRFTYYHPPFVYQINPKIGTTSGDTLVTITGSNFEDTGYVMCKFGEKLVEGQYINENEIKCISPQVEKPGKVHLSLAIRPDEYSSGATTLFRYYETPIIKTLEPQCGPERGFTQISVIGDKFPSEDSEFIKCVFNGNIFKNATVINETMLNCDSPSVLNSEGVNEKKIDFYKLELSLNGFDISGPAQNFYYYAETLITDITPKFGPLSGDTPVNITVFNLPQKNACNISFRFSTVDVTTILTEGNTVLVKSPAMNFPGSVEVQVSLNSNDYEMNQKVNSRNPAHTFYYYRLPIITDIIPVKGPTTGGTKIEISGFNLNSPYFFLKDDQEKKVYYRFVDVDTENIVYGEVKDTKVDSNSKIIIESPAVYEKNLKTKIQLSYNKYDFQTIPKEIFEFYLLPNITSIEPAYGPVVLKEMRIKVNLDNYFCVENCEKILCRYSSKNLYLSEKGYYIAPNTIECELPMVNSPDVYTLEISFDDGEEFTHNKLTYTFYKPYVLSIEPQMIPSKGNTKLFIHGYGFADSGYNLKVKFGGDNLKCENNFNELKTDCIVNAKFINENLIEVETNPRFKIFDVIKNQNLQYERFPVEVSVFNNDFTKYNFTIFYYDEPVIINDFNQKDFDKNNNTKAMEKNYIRALPSNVDTFIPLAIDSNNILKDFNRINQYANYTCLYENKNDSSIRKISEGLISSIPKNSKLKNAYFCQSPEWDKIGDFKVKISLNGKDFSESYFDIKFTDPLEILHIDPISGPLSGNNEIEIYGTGIQSDPDFIFKWGTQNIKPLVENEYFGVFDKIKEEDNANVNKRNLQSPLWLAKYNPKFDVQRIRIKVPKGLSNIKEVGGPLYVGLTKQNFLNYYNLTEQSMPFEFLHSNFEYFYYKDPYLQSINPHGSINTGGTEVIAFGSWFENYPQYGVKPYCRFGDKVVEAIFISTVRIKCTAPAYEKANIKVPFEISLNKKDFTNSSIEFIYYNDFKYAKFDSLEPLSGPQTGGTHINIYGRNLTNMVNPEEFLCKFTSEDNQIPSKIVPAGFKNLKDSNESTIICNSPGGWKSGTKAKISIAYDGQTFMDTGFDFYFYKVEKVFPQSGPSIGNGNLLFIFKIIN